MAKRKENDSLNLYDNMWKNMKYKSAIKQYTLHKWNDGQVSSSWGQDSEFVSKHFYPALSGAVSFMDLPLGNKEEEEEEGGWLFYF